MNRKTKGLVLKAAAVIIALLLVVRVFVTLFDIAGIGGGKAPVDMRVNEGASLSSIAADLKGAGVIENEFIFKLIARVSGTGIYQMGMHSFNPSMSYRKIIKELERMPEVESYKITIPEGYELRQIVDKLEKEGLINREVFMREVETGNFDYDFVKNIPARENRLEGYLYPDTYSFTGNESEHEIITVMLDNFNKKVIPVYEQSGVAQSLDEIIKLASVIEREAAGEDDRAKVASVFVNRINKGMKLESCATVQYILKERKSVLSNEDTLIDSPYNTYMYAGLPIGPIASPGIKSIEAAISPAQTNYMYFLANADGSGSVFSETYEEHLQKQREIEENR